MYYAKVENKAGKAEDAEEAGGKNKIWAWGNFVSVFNQLFADVYSKNSVNK